MRVCSSSCCGALQGKFSLAGITTSHATLSNPPKEICPAILLQHSLQQCLKLGYGTNTLLEICLGSSLCVFFGCFLLWLHAGLPSRVAGIIFLLVGYRLGCIMSTCESCCCVCFFAGQRA
ncbi:hypothetical protein VNO80_11181 [Phaseolus coccineus]|uniref:Uncharacterized protein n=1 Tax=Phaseolus coccineus TaxID=3886 RepID=A0AAN9N9Y7_PHACN